MQVEATITRIRQETPTVKSFLFDLSDAGFSFLPGQWVDFYIDKAPSTIVGGFSITSSPLQRGTIELAVKKLPHGRAATYLHERARVGDSFTIDGGFGDFHYQRNMGDSLVLIAGGIGITPLMSILRYVDEAHPDVEATLIYSAGTPSELLFLQEIRTISARSPRIRCVFTVTQPLGEPWDGHVGRIDLALLEEHTPRKGALFYICGPQPMQEDILALLLTRLGVERSHIKLERW